MIRPLTIATFLMACGSGLYLYQSKHEAQVLDRTIERTVHDTSALRDQSRLLAAEWTMLNDPDRLRQFSDTYLSLRTIAPAQFTSLSDLDSRLPAPIAEPPHTDEDRARDPLAAEPGVQMPAAAPSEPAKPIVEEALPVPPIPAAPQSMSASAPRPADHKGPASRPAAAEVSPPRVVATVDTKLVDQRTSRPLEPRVPEARPPEVHASAVPPPRPAHGPLPPDPPAANVAAAAPYGGSLLGMAHGSMPPAPRPTPVNTTQWSNTN